ncbi:hypothetical protein [Streptomyces sp. NPDC005752]
MVENGFDPLAGFRPAQPYENFDQWVDVLPNQVAAVAVRYDLKTGQWL